MNSKITAILIAFLLLVTVSTASAAELRLTQKDPVTWVEVTGGATATLTYNEVGATFDYTVVGTVPNSEPYSLIYYRDQPNRFVAWGYVGAVIVDNIIPTGAENGISASGSANIGSIPQVGDINYPAGAKIWLVPTANINTDAETATMYPDWNPTAYLFEENVNDIAGTSQLIVYNYAASSEVVGTVDVVACPIGTVGLEITPALLEFAPAYPGQSVSVSGTLEATIYGYIGMYSCEAAPSEVVVLVEATQWTGVEGNVMPAASTVITATIDGTLEDFLFGGNHLIPTDTLLDVDFVFTSPVGIVPDTYTQTITVTQIS